jgi:phage gp29-like protein
MLLDAYGNPIAKTDRGTLREQQAPPTIAGVRNPYGLFITDGMTPYRMARLHRQAAMGLSMEYMQMAEDIEERDLHYAAVIGTRKRQMSQLPLTVEPMRDDAEHGKHADFLRDWIKTGVLGAALINMADAISKGYSVLEIEWDVGPKQIVPRALTWRSQRFFEVKHADGETVQLRTDQGFVDLAPCKFIVHKHPNKSGLVLRSGIARLASFSWMAKEFTQRDWATFVQNYGQPIRLGKYGPEASAEDRDVLWTAIANIAGDCAAMVPKSMDLEFVEVKSAGEGARLHREKCDWHDQQISKAVLGQTTTTDAISGGHAVGKEHRLVQEDIERHDAMMVSSTLTQQLASVMIGLNFPGAEDAPSIHVGRPDEVPLAEVANVLARLAPFGLRVREEDVLQRLNMEKPAAGEPTIGADPASADVKPSNRDLQDAPDIDPALQSMMQRTLAMHAQTSSPELVQLMTERLARDAEGALGGLTDQVRAVINEARDMRDLVKRLQALELDTDAMTTALQRGMAIANLAGQAALLDEIRAG